MTAAKNKHTTSTHIIEAIVDGTFSDTALTTMFQRWDVVMGQQFGWLVVSQV